MIYRLVYCLIMVQFGSIVIYIYYIYLEYKYEIL